MIWVSSLALDLATISDSYDEERSDRHDIPPTRLTVRLAFSGGHLCCLSDYGVDVVIWGIVWGGIEKGRRKECQR